MGIEVLAITGGRADWGLLRPVLAEIEKRDELTLRLAATGQHADRSQDSLSAIEAAGFPVNHLVDIGAFGGSVLEVSRAMGQATIKFAELFAKETPNLTLVLGDRYEIHAAVSAALMARIPVAHLCGGDLTEGAVDDALRHGITKMSHLHFVTNSEAARRVAQLGESTETIFTVGSSGIDQIMQVPRLGREELFASLNMPVRERNILVCVHPVTLRDDSTAQCLELLAALESMRDVGIILTGSNADPGGADIDRALREFANKHENATFSQTLGSKRFLSAIAEADVMVGNSSSGLYEAPTLKTPTVNIGDRQKGRLEAHSVLDSAPTRNAIGDAIERALALDLSDVVSPYGDGTASVAIADVLCTYASEERLGDLLANKRFVDIPRNDVHE